MERLDGYGWMDGWMDRKGVSFFRYGIQMLPEGKK